MLGLCSSKGWEAELTLVVGCAHTSVRDLSLAYEIGLVGSHYDGHGRVSVLALEVGQHAADVVVRLAVSHRVDKNEAIHIAVITLQPLQHTNLSITLPFMLMTSSDATWHAGCRGGVCPPPLHKF